VICLAAAVKHLHKDLHAEVEVQGGVVLDLMIGSKRSIVLVAGQEEALVATDLSPDVAIVSDDGSTWSARVLLVRLWT
jgi:hypothetical protein